MRQPPTPDLFFETVSAYQRTEAIKAAVELDLFTLVGAAGSSADQIARQCEASERGIRILADYLTVLGFLTKKEDCYYLTSSSAAYLDRSSATYLGQALDFLLSPHLVDCFRELSRAVRKGGTTRQQGTVASEHPLWIDFARTMSATTRDMARQLVRVAALKEAGAIRVLDIAAGHGMYGITVALHNPEAEIVAVDWEPVLQVARENAAVAGVQSQYSTLAGSAFEVDFGEGYDVVLLTNFLHHFDPATCRQFLSRVKKSLVEGGRAITLEFIPDENRISPARAANFSLVMLATTPGGDAYTFSELEQMFADAGFKLNELHEIDHPSHRLMISFA